MIAADEVAEIGPMRRWRARRLGALMVALVATAALAAPAHAQDFAAADVETHCVIDVLDVLLDGEFVVSEPICFATFEEAMEFAGVGGVASGSALMQKRPDLSKATTRRSAARTQGYNSSFVIGVHFTGRNGSGSSITLTGSSCSGGYWNASSSWRNVISSSYNGCVRLSHYSELYVNGSRYDTRTIGQTDNIYGSMDNSTKSISYHSS